MENKKNIIAAISLSAAVIILYSLFFAPTADQIKKPQSDTNKTETSDTPSIEIEEKIFRLSYKPDTLKEIKVYLNGRKLNRSEFKIFSSSQKLEILADADAHDEVVIEYIVK